MFFFQKCLQGIDNEPECAGNHSYIPEEHEICAYCHDHSQCSHIADGFTRTNTLATTRFTTMDNGVSKKVDLGK